MMQVICFSKDRPLQLHGYLASLRASVRKYVGVHVLVRANEPYSAAYAEVAAEFPEVDFRYEGDFAADLVELIDPEVPFTCFGCDDVVFTRSVSPTVVARVFEDTPDLLGISLRLGQNVTRDMFGEPMPQPDFRLLHDEDFTHMSGLLTWPLSGACGDWGYPWEVLGTVYRTEFAMQVVERIRPGSPSQLEERGWRQWSQHTPARTLACWRESCLVVPTVNLVQSEFPNGIKGSKSLSPSFLLECWNNGLRMDIDRYAGMRPQSWRVPHFYLTRAA